jgi:hypothetical protein
MACVELKDDDDLIIMIILIVVIVNISRWLMFKMFSVENI